MILSDIDDHYLIACTPIFAGPSSHRDTFESMYFWMTGMIGLTKHFILTVMYIVSFTDPAFTKDKGLAYFARNLWLADSALPEIWRTNLIAYTF